MCLTSKRISFVTTFKCYSILYLSLIKQAFTNRVHDYDRARKARANNVTRHENSCTVLIENTIENYLSPARTDRYALRK